MTNYHPDHRNRPAPGQQVAFNKLPDAVWFEVIRVDGFLLTCREAPGYTEQVIDISLVAQIRDQVQAPA